MTEGKIHIKVGNLEIGYEGSEEYIKNDLLSTVEKVKDMFGIEDIPQTPIQTNMQTPQQPPIGQLKGTVTNVAAKLGVKTGPDLVLASALHLTSVEGCDSFTRKQLLTDMKNASGYYQQTYSKNLSQYIGRLLKKDKLNEVAKDTYSLPIKVRIEMESRLA